MTLAQTPRVIVALDYASAADAVGLVERISPDRCRVKVGLELFAAAGPAFVEALVARGFRVFLDLKFHDIPNTVEHACRQAAQLGVELLTAHCLGGRRMLEAARRGVGDGPKRPRVLGVTVLTSMDDSDAQEIGLASPLSERVAALAALAHDSGADGVVCAPTEAGRLRRERGPGFLLVTPGVRPAGADRGDQRRVMTPSAALQQGADLLVIGRPITQARDPAAALAAIERELADVRAS